MSGYCILATTKSNIQTQQEHRAMTTGPLRHRRNLKLLETGNYVSDRSLATALHLALQLKRPLFLEGEAGVGKTEIAKVLSKTLNRPLVRLQCYEGLDVSSAVYEWNSRSKWSKSVCPKRLVIETATQLPITYSVKSSL